ncbi:MAG: peptidoglycan DD-metalloendopeptidase family protein [Jatrophihabitans sp.]|uniref:peptidoglycan DD-metalloendopeptidase family protein n=1 Tax=Jatrophihabitans sp. TaxID=1932789 RepID=UPI003F817708
MHGVVAGLVLLALVGAGADRAGAGPGAPTGPAAAPTAIRTAPAEVRYRLPVAAPVLKPFDPPATRYGAGHRGVDLAAAQGAAVIAAGAGTVVFAGPVAGRGVVVLAHPDGLRTEYEPVRPLVRVGAVVASGTRIGVVAGRHAACAPASCVHWGARRGDVYVDPLVLLTPLGPVRLLPWSSAPP